MTSTGDAGDRRRPRTGLHLRPLNVEKGGKRGRGSGSSSGGNLAKQLGNIEWSCPCPCTITWADLQEKVALSHRRNLLFAAYSHQIYVWEPAGSSQVLGSRPEMIITPVMRNAHSQGYIAPNFPHAINNILLDDLGREEVLLLVTDSGNVCGYHVESIYSALKREEAQDRTHTRPLDGSQVDPFFVEYVEASAWGLAIHKFARLIAVTANTGLITVFAFALVNPGGGHAGSSSEPFEQSDVFTNDDQTWLEIKSSQQLEHLGRLRPNNHRTRNIKLTYTGHFTNIPSVSFLNCDLDPNGAWMASTDIDNKLIVWKVWDSLGPFHIYHFNDLPFHSFPDAWGNQVERGWAVIALDPRSFHPLKHKEEACGGMPQRHVNRGRPILDLTGSNVDVPDTSQLYNHFPPAVRPAPKQPVLPDIFGPDCRIDQKDATRLVSDNVAYDYHRSGEDSMSHGSDEHGQDDSSDGSHRGSETDSENAGQYQTDDDARQPPSYGQLTTAEFLQYALFEALGNAPPGRGVYDENYSDDDDDENDDDEEEEPTDDVTYEYCESSDGSEILTYDYPTDPSISAHFPIIQFSQTDIHLIPHPFAPHASVICGAPLRQPFTHPIVSIRASDRFNMVKYVPEHGIIIAASQKGRAAVICLTESADTGVAFRVDWIVPFQSQERFGDRPLIPLLGMAVAPLQGFEVPPDIPVIPSTGPGSRGDDEDQNEMVFHYRCVSNNDTDPSSSSSSSSKPTPASTDPAAMDINMDMDTEADHHHHHHHPAAAETTPHGSSLPNLTLPECHAKANRIYRPDESWRGWYPSRRYRLLLMYSDHTVMSYEFWYDWSAGGGVARDDDLGHG